MGRNGPGSSGQATPLAGSQNRVLVVAASPVNRIVITRMLERLYLTPTAVGPEAALETFLERRPPLVIIDGGRQAGLDAFVDEIARQRAAHQGGFPHVLFIAHPSLQADALPEGIIDAVIATPITPEALQQAVGRVVQG